MRKIIRHTVLFALRKAGVFHIVRDSHWRQNRLLILCYHGIAQADEHLWRPASYFPPDILEQRLEALAEGSYNVLPLDEGLQRLGSGDLPPRSVVITFDDGGYDFYALAHPILKKYGFPTTVYQTTYYAGKTMPVFDLVCSYMLWKRRGALVRNEKRLGLGTELDLRTERSRDSILKALLHTCNKEKLNGEQKDAVARRLAQVLDVDYDELAVKRLFHSMNRDEIAQLSEQGVNFQLHTHRHRTPDDEALFRGEIRDNRQVLQQTTGKCAVHFCYPGGVYDSRFIAWLAAENVASATTCDPGLVSRGSPPLLLPRFVDGSRRSALDFESWLTGVGSLLAVKRSAKFAPQ